MKYTLCQLLLVLPLILALGVRGQVTLVTENFSTDGETSTPVGSARHTAASSNIKTHENRQRAYRPTGCPRFW